jgi:hypothetical protein
MKFSTVEEAIGRANAFQLGLGASIWSKDVQRAEGLARKLNAGLVWVNTHVEVSPVVLLVGIRRAVLEENGELKGSSSTLICAACGDARMQHEKRGYCSITVGIGINIGDTVSYRHISPNIQSSAWRVSMTCRAT